MRVLEFSDAEYAVVERAATEFDVDVRQLVQLLLLTFGGNDSFEDIGRRLSIDPLKASRLLDRLANRLHTEEAPIRSTPGVVGGDACIRNSRIPVWSLVALKKQGATDGDLLRAYPSLEASDLSAAWSYFAAHPDQVERQMAEQQSAEV